MKYNIKERERQRDREEPGKCLRDRKMATWVRLGLAGLVGLLRKMGCLLVGLSSRGSQITPHPPLMFGRGLEYSHQKWIPKFFSCHVILSRFIVFVCAVVLHQSFFFVVGIWNLDT